MTLSTPTVCFPGERPREERWQFSLRSLMFITTVAAVCAALVGVSPLLMVALLPLIVAALVRTARAPEGSPLFVTFCESLGIFVAMIVVSATAVALASVAGSLIVAGVAYRLLTPANGTVRRTARYVWQVVIQTMRDLKAWVLTLRPDSIYDRACSYSLKGAVVLAVASRSLLRRYWYPGASGR